MTRSQDPSIAKEIKKESRRMTRSQDKKLTNEPNKEKLAKELKTKTKEGILLLLSKKNFLDQEGHVWHITTLKNKGDHSSFRKREEEKEVSVFLSKDTKTTGPGVNIDVKMNSKKEVIKWMIDTVLNVDQEIKEVKKYNAKAAQSEGAAAPAAAAPAAAAKKSIFDKSCMNREWDNLNQTSYTKINPFALKDKDKKVTGAKADAIAIKELFNRESKPEDNNSVIRILNGIFSGQIHIVDEHGTIEEIYIKNEEPLTGLEEQVVYIAFPAVEQKFLRTYKRFIEAHIHPKTGVTGYKLVTWENNGKEKKREQGKESLTGWVKIADLKREYSVIQRNELKVIPATSETSTFIWDGDWVMWTNVRKRS